MTDAASARDAVEKAIVLSQSEGEMFYNLLVLWLADFPSGYMPDPRNISLIHRLRKELDAALSAPAAPAADAGTGDGLAEPKHTIREYPEWDKAMER